MNEMTPAELMVMTVQQLSKLQKENKLLQQQKLDCEKYYSDVISRLMHRYNGDKEALERKVNILEDGLLAIHKAATRQAHQIPSLQYFVGQSAQAMIDSNKRMVTITPRVEHAGPIGRLVKNMCGSDGHGDIHLPLQVKPANDLLRGDNDGDIMVFCTDYRFTLTPAQRFIAQRKNTGPHWTMRQGSWPKLRKGPGRW
jgi:hypothetical protein